MRRSAREVHRSRAHRQLLTLGPFNEFRFSSTVTRVLSDSANLRPCKNGLHGSGGLAAGREIVGFFFHPLLRGVAVPSWRRSSAERLCGGSCCGAAPCRGASRSRFRGRLGSPLGSAVLASSLDRMPSGTIPPFPRRAVSRKPPLFATSAVSRPPTAHRGRSASRGFIDTSGGGGRCFLPADRGPRLRPTAPRRPRRRLEGRSRGRGRLQIGISSWHRFFVR